MVYVVSKIPDVQLFHVALGLLMKFEGSGFFCKLRKMALVKCHNTLQTSLSKPSIKRQTRNNILFS